MSRDDYISKLFIENQNKLDQAPSADLWSKVEAELDAPNAIATPSLRPRVWRMYAAAAAVLVVLSAASLYWFNEASTSTNRHDREPMALNTATPMVAQEEAEPYEELPPAMGHGNSVAEAKDQEEALAQEQRIVEAVQKRLEETTSKKVTDNKPIVMNDLVLSDEVLLEEMELVEPAKHNYAASGSNNRVSTIDFYQNDVPIAPQQNYNSNALPQINNATNNNAQVEQILQRSATNKSSYNNEVTSAADNADTPAETVETSKKGATASKRRGSIVAKAEQTDRIKSPMAGAHPRLYPFGFLLGRWDDDHELEGRSYEIWTLRDVNTLIGKGYKLSKDAERIFEERLLIEYRDNQIFLVISFEENSQQVDYMLTSFDQERFIFEQKGRSKYPDKVILQQNGLQGYSVTISNSNYFLTADQQRYLEHRNRVSNIRSIRTLRQTD